MKKWILGELDVSSRLLFKLSKTSRTPFYFFMYNFVLANLNTYTIIKWLIFSKGTLSNKENGRIIASLFLMVLNTKKNKLNIRYKWRKSLDSKTKSEQTRRNRERRVDVFIYKELQLCATQRSLRSPTS
jgi:hypothetical protein